MNSALDRFEESLVHASRAQHREHAAGARAAGSRKDGASGARPRRLARPRSRASSLLSRRRWSIPAGALLLAALAAAGSSVFGPTGNPREITQIECGSHGVVESVTGEPVRDCRTLWPSLYHRPAPPLVAWVYETGGAVGVMPAGRPPAGGGWRRLPSGWSAYAAVLQLHVQLEDIDTGLEAHQCWSAFAARALVTSILRADGLGSWRVRVATNRPHGAHPNCLLVLPVTGAEPHSVLLVEGWVQDSGDASSLVNTPSGPVEHARLASTETRVNDALGAGGRCASVAQAGALWRSQARADGIPDARYVLFAQPSARHAVAGCARVFVNSPGGGGPADVYAADLP